MKRTSFFTTREAGLLRLAQSLKLNGAVMSTTPDPQLEALKTGVSKFITAPTVAANGSLKDFYFENGYLVIPDALSETELEELRAEAFLICRGERGEVEGADLSVPEDSAVPALYQVVDE